MTSTTAGRATRRPAAPRPGGTAGWHAGATTVVWGTSIIVAAAWLHGGELQTLFSSGPAALESLGRIAGLVAANLLLYQVLLMARVPVFERGFGRDALTRAHRLTGFWSFWLMLTHVTLVTLGYATTAGVGVLPQLWTFIVTYPGMLLATAGLTLLIAVVVLSIRATRRRLRYESWHLLHLYAYLGIGLAIPHQLWSGADFLVSTAMTVYWWTLWSVALGCVIVFRLVVPAVLSARHGLRVAAVEPDGARGVAVLLEGRGLDRLRALAGQHFVFRFLDGPGWTRGHPFSLAVAPGGDRFALAVRLVGDGTTRLAQLRPGTRVLVEGPYGAMTGNARTGGRLLMLGAGAGVAPLVALLQAEAWGWGEATLVTRDHHPDDALLTGPITELVRTRGLRWFRLDGPRTAVGPSWLPTAFETWSGRDILLDMAGKPVRGHDIYLCGPPPWMEAVRADLAALHVPAARIHYESFTI
ncbi:ferredoxin reductase family protein [Xylanimonas sp. McL0601]|uniref:ferredoxin reductase family protein n=1 Tax=Xylanimonas sp. McL0601 TaxID=3414739 RepID=UPI003CF7BE3C